MSYLNKYLRYKKKYLLLKQQLGGLNEMDLNTGEFKERKFNKYSEDPSDRQGKTEREKATCWLVQTVIFIKLYIKKFKEKYSEFLGTVTNVDPELARTFARWNDFNTRLCEYTNQIKDMFKADEKDQYNLYNTTRSEILAKFNIIMEYDTSNSEWGPTKLGITWDNPSTKCDIAKNVVLESCVTSR
jgi:hypothetical protein